MAKLVSALPVVGCLAMCPLMMVMMMRRKPAKASITPSDDAAQLRAEVDQLRSQLSQRDDARH